MSKLKIKWLSDAHYEFGNPFDPDCSDIDVLILAGDINVKGHAVDDVVRIAQLYPKVHIVFVQGNHDAYGSSLEKVDRQIREVFNDIDSRIHYLQNSSCVIGGVKFIGATLWTDYNKNDPLVVYDASLTMNDFKHIRVNNGVNRLTPQRLMVEHNISRDYIFKELKESTMSTIIISHHQPYIDTIKTNIDYCYKSDLTQQFDELTAEQLPKLWIYGHVHLTKDETIEYKNGNVRFVTNGFGYYCFDENPYFRDNWTIEI